MAACRTGRPSVTQAVGRAALAGPGLAGPAQVTRPGSHLPPAGRCCGHCLAGRCRSRAFYSRIHNIISQHRSQGATVCCSQTSRPALPLILTTCNSSWAWRGSVPGLPFVVQHVVRRSLSIFACNGHAFYKARSCCWGYDDNFSSLLPLSSRGPLTHTLKKRVGPLAARGYCSIPLLEMHRKKGGLRL